MRNESSYDLANHINKMAVSTALAGVRQRNIFGIYMENYSTYKDAIAESEKAQGTAVRKMEAYNESVAYSINQLSVAWEGFTQKLEASPIVKFGYKFLTFLVETLDHILQRLVPLIAAFNADKIISLAKFLSPLVTAIPKAVAKPFEEVKSGKHVGSGFYENMTQKMTAENTNAIEELTNAMKDNTAALRGEKPKSGADGTSKGDISDKSKAKKVRSGSIQDLQNQIDIGEQGIQGFKELGLDEDSEQIKKIRARQEELREQILKKQGRYARLKTGAAAGIAAGFTRFANKGSSIFDNEKLDLFGWFKGAGDVEVSGGEAAAMGGIQAVLTAGLTAWLGPLGTMIASIGGDFLSSLWKKLAHADEIARKERVQQAKDNLEAIKGISTAVTGLIDIRKKGDTSLWDADDWKQANEYVESLEKARSSSIGFQDALNDAVEGLGNYTLTIEKLTENQETLAKVEAARIKYEAEQTYAAGEQDRYDALKEIEKAQRKLMSNNEDERKQAEAIIKANRAAIREYTDELNKAYMRSAFYSSGVSNMSQAQKNTASLNRLIVEMAEEAEKAAEGKTDEKFFEDNGTLKSEYRSKLIQQLREQGGYEAVLTESEKSVADYNRAVELANDTLTKLSGEGIANSVDDLKKLVNTKDGITKLGDALKKAGMSVENLEKIVDQINDADETKVATIAHSLNMTVEDFNEANKNGDFDFFTTGMAVENLDAFIDRIDKLNGYLAELATNGKLSAESLENVAKNYVFLMQSRTEQGSFGAGNILENLADLYARGSESTIAQALAGKFQRKAATDETWWSAWTQSDVGKAFVKRDSKNTTFTSFSSAISSMNDAEKQSYIDYVASLYNTDLYEEVQKQLIEWQTKAYDSEISNLESIKDSLDDVNKQREKELELIKAKEALENASKEKKRIYRAGVGFVYTTDQEAVKSAQDKVNELERQQDRDNIQYQIDMLEQQKSILENIENNKQLENLTNFVEKIQLALNDPDGNLFSAIFENDSTKENMKNIIAQGIAQNAQDVKDQENIQATEAALAAYKAAGEDYDKFMENNKSILEDKNNPAYANAYAKWLEKTNALTDARSAYNSASEIKPAGNTSGIKSEWGNVTSNTYSGKTGSRHSVLDDSVNVAKILFGPTWFDVVGETNKAIVGADMFISDESPVASGQEFEKHMIGKNRSMNDTYIIGRYDTDSASWQFYSTHSKIDDFESQLKPYDILINNWSNPAYNDRAVFVDAEGKFRWVNADSGKIYAEKWDKKLGTSEGLPKNASGTLSYPGGRSLINENGLESIITPQGTITSLPAKSGIVPADLTRNLWALGEVAPNLIARLGGNNLQTNNNNATNDNSINIDKLNATFNTDSGFDGQAFINSLKHEVALTKNNH